jgi:hypothetical protein
MAQVLPNWSLTSDSEESASDTPQAVVAAESPDEPQDILETAGQTSSRYDELLQAARNSMIPVRSAAVYEKHYSEFEKWMKDNGLQPSTTTGENLAAYVQHLSSSYAASTMWSRFSAVKKGLIKTFGASPDVALATAVLKAKAATHVPKKASTFTRDSLGLAFESLSDEKFIHGKLAVILMIHGALRRDEATNLLWGDVKRFDDHLQVFIRTSKVDQAGAGWHFFAMANLDQPELCPIRIFDSYSARVSDAVPESRLFRQLRELKAGAKFTKQPLGHTFFDKLGKLVASAAGSPNPGSC